MQQEQNPYVGVVMLQKPQLDKIAAKTLLERRQGELPVALFWNDSTCPPDQFLRWERDENLFPIDLGPEKYHDLGTGSATEAISFRFEMHLSEAEKQLVDIVNKNNGDHRDKGGYLKGFHMSIAWTLRKLYEIPGYDHHEVIKRAGHVVHTWLDALETESQKDGASLENAPGLAELVQMTAKCQFSDFTPGRYMRDLWRTGHPAQEIVALVTWWVEGYEAFQVAFKKATETFASMDKQTFLAGGLRGMAIQTDDTFVSDRAARACDVLIVHTMDGHAAIKTNRLDISSVVAAITRQEPDNRWYYQRETGHLMNGGVMYTAVPTTTLTSQQLIALVQANPPRRHQAHRRKETRPGQHIH